jgi:hypothetical protein
MKLELFINDSAKIIVLLRHNTFGDIVMPINIITFNEIFTRNISSYDVFILISTDCGYEWRRCISCNHTAALNKCLYKYLRISVVNNANIAITVNKNNKLPTICNMQCELFSNLNKEHLNNYIHERLALFIYNVYCPSNETIDILYSNNTNIRYTIDSFVDLNKVLVKNRKKSINNIIIRGYSTLRLFEKFLKEGDLKISEELIERIVFPSILNSLMFLSIYIEDKHLDNLLSMSNILCKSFCENIDVDFQTALIKLENSRIFVWNRRMFKIIFMDEEKNKNKIDGIVIYNNAGLFKVSI